ncbi:MAG: glycosyltransferase family 9 protein [Chromatiaceae bacterium]|nr:MAG: glycosyltransferase family 9 protein [Chromatiaceae bacterium]
MPSRPPHPAPSPLPIPRRVLLVRLSAIGDVLFASPLIAAARQAWPAAHLAWLAEPGGASLLQAHPDLDELIEWPSQRLRTLWHERRLAALLAELRQQRRALRARGFDLALDLQGLFKSALPVWLSGAPVRIGLGSREGSGRLMTRVIPRTAAAAEARIGSEYLHLAQALGLAPGAFPLTLHLAAEAQQQASALRRAHGIDRAYAVLCPFTTRPQKHWFAERWAELAQHLQRIHGLAVLVLGGPGDRAAGAALSARAAGALIDLSGQTRLPEAAALIAGARLVIAVDTGLGHMGIALARPTLLLFGATCPYTDTTRANARVLYHPLPCSPCRRRPTCGGAYTCMREHSVAAVLAAATALLAAPAADP